MAQRPRALANLQYNSILSNASGTSSEDEEAPETSSENASAAVGISIGREQSRLTSPKTPAIEKAAAIDEAGGFFNDSYDGSIHRLVEEPEQAEDVERASNGTLSELGDGEEVEHVAPDDQPSPPSSRSPYGTGVRLPSPWRAQPKKFERTDKTRSVLRDGLIFNRRRASSGSESTLDSWHKAIMASLPSMPKHFSISSPFMSSRDATHDKFLEGKVRSRRSGSFFAGYNLQWPSLSGLTDSNGQSQSSRRRADSDSRRRTLRRLSSAHEAEGSKAIAGDLPSRPQLQTLRSRNLQLRRSNSDDSLLTAQTLSRVSSLGDDTRFEHVQEQVNSRLRAIRDSWQDSNIKLPSMPTISNFNVSNLRPEFLRERPASATPNSSAPLSPGRGRAISESASKSAQPVDPMTRQPYHSAKAAVSNASKSKNRHPHFNRALGQLEGDVVVLGGYRGSILRSAQPPHRQLWVPIKVGLNIRKVDLEVGLGQDGDERAVEKVIPGGMLTHIGPVDISRRLFKRLRASDNARTEKVRVHDYGYDWRLHPHHLSKQLIAFFESLPCNKATMPASKRGATVIAHSLGGLITRHAVNQRPELFRGVVYAGVPDTCVNILGPMRNGDDVLLSSRVLTAQVNFTVRTSFALLPLDGRCFFDKRTREEYLVDFFDVNSWIDYRLSPCVGRPLPPLTAPPEPTGISGYMSSVAKALPSLPIPGRTNTAMPSIGPADASRATQAGVFGELDMLSAGSDDAVANNNIDAKYSEYENSAAPSVSTAVTIPREEAIAYLDRTLPSIKKFKQELAFIPAHAASNRYPPVSVIYGKTAPTVYGAKVDGREGIKHADAYDELAFASGDGVVLARAAMVPDGYSVTKNGVISSDRGHVTLLGDLEAVGRCLNAVIGARERGVGCGIES